MMQKSTLNAELVELEQLRQKGVILPRHPGRAITAARDGADIYKNLQASASHDLDRASVRLGRPISSDNYDSPEVQRILKENSALTNAMGSKRAISRRTASAFGSDIFNAIPRFYDPLEYWDLSGLPWNVADEGHRHKLHKWLRLYYATHYLVPILVDIFTRFPLVGMKVECKDEKLVEFYEDLFFNQLDYGEFLVNLGREFWCALPGEQVQGFHSIVPIESVKAGDQVLTHTGQVKTVLGASSKQYEGGYVTLRPHYGLPMRYTYGHPFLVKRDKEQSWVPIEEIKTTDSLYVPVDQRVVEKTHVSVWETLEKSDWLPVPDESELAEMKIPEYVGWTDSKSQYRGYVRRKTAGLKSGDVWRRNRLYSQASTLDSEHELDEEFLWFIGLYLAEGYVTKDGVQIALHAKEVDYAERVVAFADRLGLNATIRKGSSENGILVVIYSISFGAWINSLIGTGHDNKKLPSWAMTLPPDRQSFILRGYFDGDGHYGDVKVFAASASLTIATQIERIIRRLGVVTTINEASSVTSLGTECTWWMVGPSLAYVNKFMDAIGKDSNYPERDSAFAEWDGPGYWVKVFKADHDMYSGLVYNFEVEDDHSYVGSVATHNCVGEAFPLGSFDENLGVWEREELINPEDVVIENYPLLGTQELKIVPPDYLKKLAQLKEPAKEYRLLEMNFPDIIPYLRRGEHIPISGVLLKQIANKLNGWDDHGTPILLRGLRTLLHEEKLLASQDAIAERLYSPLILAKLGIMDMGDGMPPFIPGPEELDDVRDQFDQALSSDFRLLVHHFGLEVSSVFGREQMPRLGDDFDRIERRLMQVFGVNPSLLSAGSNSQPYASSALQAEFLNQILRTFQNTLKAHFRERAAVVAEAQGHYDFEMKGSTKVDVYETIVKWDMEGNKKLVEVPKLLVPELDFQTLDLRDEATERQFLQGLRQLGVPIPDQDLMVGIHWDLKDKVADYNAELKTKTIAQQRAKYETYTALVAQRLPVPPDLQAEVESVLQAGQPAPEGMMAGGPPPMDGAAPGMNGPGGPDGGPAEGPGGIVMPGPPAGLGSGPGAIPPGGGPPPATPTPGGPRGTVPEVSNERRPGLTYNTSEKHSSNIQEDGLSLVDESDILTEEDPEPELILKSNQELREGSTENVKEEGPWILEKNAKKRYILDVPPEKKYSIVDPEATPLSDEEEVSESTDE